MNTSNVLQENIKPMQTPAESLAELEQLIGGQTPQLLSENNNVVAEQKEQNRTKCKKFLQDNGLSEKNASEIASLYRNPEAFPHSIELSPRVAIILNKLLSKFSIDSSVLAFYRKLIVTVFSECPELVEEEIKKFPSESVVNYALACYNLNLSPFDVSFVKPLCDKDKLEIKPFVMLAGLEHLLVQTATDVKIKYEISLKETKVFLPVDPDQDLNNLDTSDMYWDSTTTSVPENIKCIISYSDGSRTVEVEGYSFAKGDIALTPFWAKNHMLMMQHTAFKRAAKLIVKAPSSAFEEYATPPLTEGQIKRKVTKYETDIANATIYTIGYIQRSIASHKKVLGSFYDHLNTLVAKRIANLELQNEKTIVVSPAKEEKTQEQLENENGFTILTNKDTPPTVISDAEKESVWRSLGGF